MHIRNIKQECNTYTYHDGKETQYIIILLLAVKQMLIMLLLILLRLRAQCTQLCTMIKKNAVTNYKYSILFVAGPNALHPGTVLYKPCFPLPDKYLLLELFPKPSHTQIIINVTMLFVLLSLLSIPS
jgi:hypothetical protein